MRTVLRFLALGAIVGLLLWGGVLLLEHVQARGGIPPHDAHAGTYYVGILLGAPTSFIGFWIGDTFTPGGLRDTAVFPLLVLNWTLIGGLVGVIRRDNSSERPAK
jgi:hypothetical protein